MKALKWILSIFLSVAFIFISAFGINCFYGYLFPMKFEEEVKLASNFSGLDESVIFSIINIESHFDKDALSSKGAVGLMQVMPATAEEIVSNLSEPEKLLFQNFQNESLGEANAKTSENSAFLEQNLKIPVNNILIGTKYFSQLMAKFDDLNLALCAYNAGPTTVKTWLVDKRYSDDGKKLSHIPFEETEKYIQRFQNNLNYYSRKTK